MVEAAVRLEALAAAVQTAVRSEAMVAALS